MDREIPDDDAAKLRTVLKQPPDSPLSDTSTKIYWQVSVSARRLHKAVDDTLLVLIAMLADRPTPDTPVSFLDAIKTTKVKHGDMVIVDYRGETVWGYFQGVAGKKVLVRLEDGTAETREFFATKVRLPLREELAAVGAAV